jgi:hypothetical protein
MSHLKKNNKKKKPQKNKKKQQKNPTISDEYIFALLTH